MRLVAPGALLLTARKLVQASSTASRAWRLARSSRCDSGPAFSPIRVSSSLSPLNYAIGAPGAPWEGHGWPPMIDEPRRRPRRGRFSDDRIELMSSPFKPASYRVAGASPIQS
jgi:hypothetical protein